MSDPMNSRDLIEREIRAALRDDDELDAVTIGRMATRVHEAIWGQPISGSGEGAAPPLIVPGELQEREAPADGRPATIQALLDWMAHVRAFAPAGPETDERTVEAVARWLEALQAAGPFAVAVAPLWRTGGRSTEEPGPRQRTIYDLATGELIGCMFTTEDARLAVDSVNGMDEIKAAFRLCQQGNMELQGDVGRLEGEVEQLRAALELVHEEGRVCPEYETCDHAACQSSYTSWAIADEALKTLEVAGG